MHRYLHRTMVQPLDYSRVNMSTLIIKYMSAPLLYPDHTVHSKTHIHRMKTCIYNKQEPWTIPQVFADKQIY